MSMMERRLVALLIALATFLFSSGSESCRGSICGNKQFLPADMTSFEWIPLPTVKILVYSVWVGEPLEANRLNHKVYCEINGYEYRHFHMTNENFSAIYGSSPQAWYSVYMAKELLETSDANYFFKMDIDCLFVRTDVRLESILDPLQRYSFYVTNTEPTSRFMQSQSWILKNSEYGKTLINEWLDYVHWGTCANLAYEQGAMHLMLGTAYSWHLGQNGTAYTCPSFCNSKTRSAYKHHHCVLDWLEDNGFGVSGSMNIHPHIYVYPFPQNGSQYNSPDDGFFMELPVGKELGPTYHPLTVHPLKHHIYEPPSAVLKHLRGVHATHGRRLRGFRGERNGTLIPGPVSR